MKRNALLLLLMLCSFINAKAQEENGVYKNVLTYANNATLANGIKIKTNLPFTSWSQMPTIIIEGYTLGSARPIGLVISYYIDGTSTQMLASSFGAYTPPLYLANENGKVVIFMDSKEYYLRFGLRAFAKGMSLDVAASYDGWSVADEPLTGSNKVQINYINQFGGAVLFANNGIWNEQGNVGIGTTNPGQHKLAVEGTIGARRIKVTQTNPWPDYVFSDNYSLPSLYETEQYIKAHQHLPAMPSAKEVATNGLDLGEMNRQLLEKMEEMTLHMINMQKK
ncbi:hypothetical protein ACDQ55_04550 [Chitinophaga sp. 30R24]|uniref:hypothetical protein n=1 Tax=Chitinophaga sp. 30R24 TaxID=3248838 RepID=UPI003B917C4C